MPNSGSATNRPTLVVLEDSSKSLFGGGQKVTLSVLGAIAGRYDAVLFDCAIASQFIDRASALSIEVHSLRCRGEIVGARRASFSLGIKEVLLSPVALLRAVGTIRSRLREKQLFADRAVLYCATKKTLLFGFLLHIVGGYRYLFHAHSLDSRKSLWFWVMRIPIRLAKRVICVSEVVKQNLRTPNCRVIYNPGPETIRTTVRPLHRPLHVAVFSSLLKWKGIVYFLRSHRYLNCREDVYYHVFGDGPERSALSAYCNSHVRMEGFTKNPSLVMQNSVDVVVVPSISTEACPMAPIEALSCGVPVISTNIGGQAEIVVDGMCGKHVRPRSALAIAVAIDDLLYDPAEYERLSAGAVERARAFEPILFGRRMLAVLEATFR